jgi:mono/diheme cytochrome c family protein
MTHMHRFGFALVAVSLLVPIAAPAVHAQQTAPPPLPVAAPTGDAARGKTLFDNTLRCYACHGFDGQTGSPRLVPMARPEDVFLAYVKKPATAGMPSFRDAADRDLRDVYAYIRSIPRVAPDAASIPLLQGIINRRTSAR